MGIPKISKILAFFTVLVLLPGCGSMLLGVAFFQLGVDDKEDTSTPYVPPPPDTTAPAGIADLVANPGSTNGSVDLSWTATGDDGNSGGSTAAYIVKYALSAITQAGFDSATTYNQGWMPLAPGSGEKIAASSCSPYFLST